MRQAFSWTDPDCSERGLAGPAYVLFQSNEMEYPMPHLKSCYKFQHMFVPRSDSKMGPVFVMQSS